MLSTGAINGYKFRFAPKRKAWAWAPYTYRGKKSNASTEELAQKYGHEGYRV